MKIPVRSELPCLGRRQLSLVLDGARLREMTAPERGAAMMALAHLLMAAAGIVSKEPDDDRR
ncbi:MAG: hypothetical protein FJX57_13920 [Alphaproteobacteria bacterium]|nr:hypothetical protein [Alphaproteobacteria bacterium]